MQFFFHLGTMLINDCFTPPATSDLPPSNVDTTLSPHIRVMSDPAKSAGVNTTRVKPGAVDIIHGSLGSVEPTGLYSGTDNIDTTQDRTLPITYTQAEKQMKPQPNTSM